MRELVSAVRQYAPRGSHPAQPDVAWLLAVLLAVLKSACARSMALSQRPTARPAPASAFLPFSQSAGARVHRMHVIPLLVPSHRTGYQGGQLTRIEYALYRHWRWGHFEGSCQAWSSHWNKEGAMPSVQCSTAFGHQRRPHWCAQTNGTVASMTGLAERRVSTKNSTTAPRMSAVA